VAIYASVGIMISDHSPVQQQQQDVLRIHAEVFLALIVPILPLVIYVNVQIMITDHSPVQQQSQDVLPIHVERFRV
jgi:hypothetical protein